MLVNATGSWPSISALPGRIKPGSPRRCPRSHAMRLATPAAARSMTLNELARRAGMSRSPFARRFRERVGETPIAYLTAGGCCWQPSGSRREANPLAEAARSLGYGSEKRFKHGVQASDGLPTATLRPPRSGLLGSVLIRAQRRSACEGRDRSLRKGSCAIRVARCSILDAFVCIGLPFDPVARSLRPSPWMLPGFGDVGAQRPGDVGCCRDPHEAFAERKGLGLQGLLQQGRVVVRGLPGHPDRRP